MNTPTFKSEDKDLQHVYNNANSLVIGSLFEYVGSIYEVTGFTKTAIKAKGIDGKVKKFAAIDFEGYITYGFLKIAI